MKKSHSGFTFFQLIIVLVVIAVIAVLAIPRFINQTTNARLAALNGLVDAINNSTIVSASQYHLNNVTTSNNNMAINVKGKMITVSAGTGFPTANEAGIGSILPSLTDYSVNYKDNIATYNFTTPIADCMVTYNAGTGQAVAVESGC